MPSNTSMLSYDDIRTLLDRAMASDRGIRVTLDSPGAATHFVHRCRAFCKMDRNENKKVYSATPDHPMYGKSAYDKLLVKQVKEEALTEIVTIEKRTEIVYQVDEL